MSTLRFDKNKMLKHALLLTGGIALFGYVFSFALIAAFGYTNNEKSYTSAMFVETLLSSAFIAVSCIVHYRLIYQRLWLQRRYVSYLLYNAVLVCIWSACILYLSLPRLTPLVPGREIYFGIVFLLGYLIIIIIPIVATYTAINEFFRHRIRKKELAHEIRKTSILLLKSKLEPHFLFNTLNAIYAIAQKEKANNSIAKIDTLSAHLRDEITTENNQVNVVVQNRKKDTQKTSGPFLHFVYTWLVLCGLLVLIYLSVYLWDGKWIEDPIKYLVYRPTMAATIALAIVSHFHVLYKPLVMQGRYKRYFLLLPVFVVLLIFIDSGVNGIFVTLHYESEYYGSLFKVATRRVLILDSLCALIYALIHHLRMLNREEQETIRKTQENELLLMQKKIDTSALFNSLNDLQEIVDGENAPETATAIKQLIALFKYSVNKADKETVAVSEEIQFIEQYLHLQKMRVQLGKDMVIRTAVKWDEEPADIAPMLLLPYIENAFKYGISYEHSSEINIYISVEKQTIECRISNTDHSATKKRFSSGLGLSSTSKRLQLQYEGKYLLEQKTEDGTFSIYLKIDLQ